jgi:hypothetical protein
MGHKYRINTYTFQSYRFKNGKQITSNGKYKMSYKDKHAKLIVTDTKPEDAASYKCVGSNIIGSVETSANLIVHCEFAFLG